MVKVIQSLFLKYYFPDLVIIVECKKDRKFHESKEGNNFALYAVDGVSHYSKALSKI